MTLAYELACERADAATQRAETAESKLALAEASHRITQGREVAATLERDRLQQHMLRVAAEHRQTYDAKDARLTDTWAVVDAHKARIKVLEFERDKAQTTVSRLRRLFGS